MLSVGLTGGIACGKSHVLRRLAAGGCPVLDLDQVSREVMAPGGAAYADVLAAFGAQLAGPDGRLDRAALARRVFADEAARERLNALVHPRIRELEERFRRAHAGEPEAVAVVDGALLVEAGMHLRFDRLVVVHCSDAEQLDRLRARDGLDAEAAAARVRAQMPQAEKRRLAHFTISTSGAPEETDRRTDLLLATLQGLARSRPPAPPPPDGRAAAALSLGPREGPQGLAPARLLELASRFGGLDLARLALAMGRPPGRPWYRPEEPAADAPRVEALAAALAVWCLSNQGDDPDYLLGAAASLACLLDPRPPALGRLCGWARLAFELARAGGAGPQAALSRAWADSLGPWGGEAPRPELEAAQATLASASDLPAARRRAREDGLDPALLAALWALSGRA